MPACLAYLSVFNVKVLRDCENFAEGSFAALVCGLVAGVVECADSRQMEIELQTTTKNTNEWKIWENISDLNRQNNQLCTLFLKKL